MPKRHKSARHTPGFMQHWENLLDASTIDSMARLFQSVAEAKIHDSSRLATVLDFQRRRRGITS
jgi:hypothetical protein